MASRVGRVSASCWQSEQAGEVVRRQSAISWEVLGGEKPMTAGMIERLSAICFGGRSRCLKQIAVRPQPARK
jgi:hypothetical protein